MSLVQARHHLLYSPETYHANRQIACVDSILKQIFKQLPAKNKQMVFTLPGISRRNLCVPGFFVREILEKFDPHPETQIPLELPQRFPVREKVGGERMLRIRRHKMRKHKRRKRFDRDYFKYQKYHRQKKAKAENLFKNRMSKIIEGYRAFDPEKYIKDIIARAKQDVTKDVAPSGRRKYPHWSTLVTLEELYGLPSTDYIDKKAGLVGEDDRDKIRLLKNEYDEKYRGFLCQVIPDKKNPWKSEENRKPSNGPKKITDDSQTKTKKE
ncbi:unnamed protein product [Thelazia callipaeda]|uniref:DUF1713 domain-containing protein n=1 Tax=Thelazia callipaeda TaxID=103827 RepID=A0A0N5CLV5_THECL|nr:unnamed protein product [Thelazia callipaeda]